MKIDTHNYTVHPLLLGLFLLTIVGSGLYLYVYPHRKNIQVAPVTPVVSDSPCNGGTYTGMLNTDMLVTMLLSCDQKKVTVTGAVTQTITATDIGVDTHTDLVDTIAGSGGVVAVDTDYNFDGYNDLALITSRGGDVDAITSYAIFLYNAVTKKFEYNSELSAIENIGVNEPHKWVTSTYTCAARIDKNDCHSYAYTWVAGHLKKVN